MARLKEVLGYPLMLMMLTACVTINIYFPAAAAEDAARTIVRDVLSGEQPNLEPAPPKEPQGSVQGHPLAVLFGRTMSYLVPEVQAAQANININTAAISALRASMQRRQASLAAHYRSGAIGFDRQGSVAVRDQNAIPLAQRNAVQKLVADENADRARLYREIAAANGHPEWETDVRTTFAKVWAEEALPGYWYQDQGGSWRQR